MPVDDIITDQAERDLTEVHVWYELRGDGLGDEFLERFEQCLDSIRQRPLVGRLIYKEYRRALLKQWLMLPWRCKGQFPGGRGGNCR